MYEAALLEYMQTELNQPLMTQLATLDINQGMSLSSLMNLIDRLIIGAPSS
jgi:hypothetical protein